MKRTFKPAKKAKRKHNYQRCNGKVRYRDQREARAALQRLNATSKRDKVPSRVYWCYECNGHHLTSRPDRYAS